MLLFTLTMLVGSAAAASCGSFTNAFADMHDGDVKNVTVSEDGFLVMSQSAPVAWSLKVSEGHVGWGWRGLGGLQYRVKPSQNTSLKPHPHPPNPYLSLSLSKGTTGLEDLLRDG